MKFCPKCETRMLLKRRRRLSLIHWVLRNKEIDERKKEYWYRLLRDKTKRIIFDEAEFERTQNESFRATLRRTKDVVYQDLNSVFESLGLDPQKMKEEYKEYVRSKPSFWKCMKCSYKEEISRGDEE